MDCAGLVVPTSWVANVRLAADKVALGPEVSPTPLRETECGLPTVLSVIVTDALRGPNWLGVKVTLMVQFAPAARLDPHVLLLWLKSAALAPVSAMLLTTTADYPDQLWCKTQARGRESKSVRLQQDGNGVGL